MTGPASSSRLSVLYTVLLLVCIFCIVLVAVLTIAILLHNSRTKSVSLQQLVIRDFSLEMKESW